MSIIHVLRKKPLPLTKCQMATVTTVFNHPIIEQGIDIKPFESIPGPMKLPYFKSSWAFLPIFGTYDMSRIETSHSKLYEKYGKIVRIEFPKIPPIIYLYDHELFQRVSNIEGLTPRRFGFAYAAQYRETQPQDYPNSGLIMLYGDPWRTLRHAIRKPMLRFPSVRSTLNPMDKVTKDFVKRIQGIRNANMDIDNFMDELALLTTEYTGVFTFNKRFGCLDASSPETLEAIEIHKAACDIIDLSGYIEFDSKWTHHAPQKTFQKIKKTDLRFAQLVYKVLDEAMKDRETSSGEKKAKGPCLLDSFLFEYNVDPNLLKGIMLDIYLASSTTVTSVATFLMHHIASNKDKQDLLYREIVREFPTKDTPVTTEKLDNMLYLRACIKENLRLHPVVVGTGRIFDCDVTVGGYRIPKGSTIVSVTPLTSRLEKYFELPNQFVPERWLHDFPGADDLRKAAGLTEVFSFQPHSAVPFGHGVRMCAGRRFAEQEMFLLLIRLLQRFELEYNGEPLEMKQGFFNVPASPVRIRFKDRTSYP